MTLQRIGAPLTMLLLLCLASPAAAQRAQVSGVVLNDRGELPGNARVRATAKGVDTTVRTNDRGQYSLSLPVGTVRMLVTAFGYEAFEPTVWVVSRFR